MSDRSRKAMWVPTPAPVWWFAGDARVPAEQRASHGRSRGGGVEADLTKRRIEIASIRLALKPRVLTGISIDSRTEAIAHPANGKVSFVVKNFNPVQSRENPYAGGLRYPHLERIPGSRDVLTEILAARSIADR